MYTVKELSRLTGLTPRTLRYYDGIGLLRPQRSRDNDYRLYGPGEVDRLMQILLYRDAGLPLEEIRRILEAPDFNRTRVLRAHLDRLLERRREMDALIRTVRSILTEGGCVMTDREKFEGIKRLAIQENEAAYGREAREKYGDDAVDEYNARITGMPGYKWEQMKREEEGYKAALLRAVDEGNPAGESAREAVRLHAAWLAHYWSEDAVTSQTHAGLTAMYVQDARFTAYYEEIAPGGAAFLAEAVKAYYSQNHGKESK